MDYLKNEDVLGTDLKLFIGNQTDTMGLGADIIVNKKGDLQTVSGRENLGQAILHRLLTRQGELGDIGHPEYGSRLHELIGEPNNDRTRDLIRLYTKECLSQEFRIREVFNVSVNTLKDNNDTVIIDITVLPIKSNIPMNMVFPFYLEI